MSGGLTIVVPVFNALEQTQRCLESLHRTLESAPDDIEVLIIDDASTDAGINLLLNDVARRWPHWQIQKQLENRGFVATANLGMRIAGNQDVILLNSDTIPAGDWLQRMRRCAASNPTIASITPFSNNGEIVSLPDLCRAAPVPAQPERWARACQAVQPPRYPAIPTAVGFCMYLRRACLNQIGDFDEQAFGRGYGEENDWCMRATAAGWEHVLCDDAFVAHEGNASFGPLGLKPDAASMQRLQQRHPQYAALIQDFIQRDPLAEVRRRILAHSA